jgi:hypothetical protein
MKKSGALMIAVALAAVSLAPSASAAVTFKLK